MIPRHIDTDTAPDEGRLMPHFDSAVAVFALGLVLATGGLLLPTSVRWIMWPLAMTVPGHAIISAAFGRHLDFSGFRRAGLTAAMTLVAYPLLALTGLVLGLRLTHLSVVLSTAVLTSGCAGVILRRERSEAVLGIDHPEQLEEPPEVGSSRIRLSELIIPTLAIGTSMLIALASISVFPRKAPDEFSSIALEGTWALAAHVVPADPGRDITVSFRIDNETTRRQEYIVRAAMVDGPDWSTRTRILEPGQAWVDTVGGRVTPGSCRSRLEIDMEVVGDPEDHFPLAVFFRDNTIDC